MSLPQIVILSETRGILMLMKVVMNPLNPSGLYRYRLGDVLKVKGFRKTLPIFEFVQRKDVILSIHADKTDEKELQAVTNKACKLLEGTPLELADYTSTGDITSFPGHYILFWEMVDSR